MRLNKAEASDLKTCKAGHAAPVAVLKALQSGLQEKVSGAQIPAIAAP